MVENNSGTNNLIFKVTLSTTSTQTITVNYGTADNTATAGSDYTTTNRDSHLYPRTNQPRYYYFRQW
ncbi:MAG UNVERIFIED_CONTAM: hypothetical protein LVR29_07180 [Microcystis novacekii LVE1205-3]